MMRIFAKFLLLCVQNPKNYFNALKMCMRGIYLESQYLTSKFSPSKTENNEILLV